MAGVRSTARVMALRKPVSATTMSFKTLGTRKLATIVVVPGDDDKETDSNDAVGRGRHGRAFLDQPGLNPAAVVLRNDSTPIGNGSEEVSETMMDCCFSVRVVAVQPDRVSVQGDRHQVSLSEAEDA